MNRVVDTVAAPSYAAVVKLAQLWQERRANVHYLIPNGRKTDACAVEFVGGACKGAELAGNEDLASHLRMIFFLVCTRGASELKAIAEGAT